MTAPPIASPRPQPPAPLVTSVADALGAPWPDAVTEVGIGKGRVVFSYDDGGRGEQ